MKDKPLPPDGVPRGWWRDIWQGWAFIHPQNDIFAHEALNQNCSCSPSIFYEHHTVQHHAWDGRDLWEALQRGESII